MSSHGLANLLMLALPPGSGGSPAANVDRLRPSSVKAASAGAVAPCGVSSALHKFVPNAARRLWKMWEKMTSRKLHD